MNMYKITGSLRKDLPMILVLATLIIVSSIILVLMVRSEREKNKVLSKYRAERIIQVLLDSMRSGDFDATAYEKEIIGFGLYSVDGTPLRTFGSAPDVIDPGKLKKGQVYFKYNRKKDSMIMVRESRPGIKEIMEANRGQPREDLNFDPANLLPGRPNRDIGHPPPRDQRMPPPRDTFFENAAAYIYLEVNFEYFTRMENFITMVFIVFIVLIFGLAAGFWQLSRRNREYRQRIEAQKQLVVLGGAARTIAHEIKNPLSIIKLQTGLIKKIAGDSIEYEVGVINDEVERLRMLTDRVREFLREPSGSPESIEVNDSLTQLVSKMNPIITVSASVAPCFISFDPELFRSVIENLLKNALESGGPEDEVGISVEKQRKNVVISILDRGTGLSDENGDKIFDPFFTSKTSGSGIGLFISKRFVEAAGGTLIIKNRENGGVRAVVTVPGITK